MTLGVQIEVYLWLEKWKSEENKNLWAAELLCLARACNKRDDSGLQQEIVIVSINNSQFEFRYIYCGCHGEKQEC